MISAKWSYIIVKSVAGAYTLLQSSCLYPNPSFVSRCPRQLYFCETLVGQHPACSHCQTPQSTINELINRDLTNVRVTRDVPWLGQILGENRSLLRSFPTKREPRSIVKHLFIPPVSIYLERTIFTSWDCTASISTSFILWLTKTRLLNHDWFPLGCAISSFAPYYVTFHIIMIELYNHGKILQKNRVTLDYILLWRDSKFSIFITVLFQFRYPRLLQYCKY